jgi:hypothetical protein
MTKSYGDVKFSKMKNVQTKAKQSTPTLSQEIIGKY